VHAAFAHLTTEPDGQSFRAMAHFLRADVVYAAAACRQYGKGAALQLEPPLSSSPASAIVSTIARETSPAKAGLSGYLNCDGNGSLRVIGNLQMRGIPVSAVRFRRRMVRAEAQRCDSAWESEIFGCFEECFLASDFRIMISPKARGLCVSAPLRDHSFSPHHPELASYVARTPNESNGDE